MEEPAILCPSELQRLMEEERAVFGPPIEEYDHEHEHDHDHEYVYSLVVCAHAHTSCSYPLVSFVTWPFNMFLLAVGSVYMLFLSVEDLTLHGCDSLYRSVPLKVFFPPANPKFCPVGLREVESNPRLLSKHWSESVS